MAHVKFDKIIERQDGSFLVCRLDSVLDVI